MNKDFLQMILTLCLIEGLKKEDLPKEIKDRIYAKIMSLYILIVVSIEEKLENPMAKTLMGMLPGMKEEMTETAVKHFLRVFYKTFNTELPEGAKGSDTEELHKVLNENMPFKKVHEAYESQRTNLIDFLKKEE